MFLKLILLIQVISTILTLKNLRLKEIETLVQKFESQLDTNYLFYDKVHSQKNHPLVCDAAYGPKCLLVNSDSLLDTIEEDDSQETQIKKAKVMLEWNKIRDQVKTAPEGTFYVVTNHVRDSLMGRTNIIPPEDVEGLIDFEKIDLNEEEGPMEGSLVYEFDRGFTFEAHSKIQKDSQNTMRISFENMVAPKRTLIFTKHAIFDNQKYLDNNKETPLEDLKPSLVYLHTKKEEPGIIRFSKPIVVNHVYLRKNSVVTYVNERTAKGLEKNIYEHRITGQFKNTEAVVFEKESEVPYNQWVKVTPNKEGVMIDSLVIDHNMDIDNIYFTIQKERSNAQLTAKEFQQMLASILDQVTKLSHVKDDNQKTFILKDHIRTYLKKRGLNPDTIDRIAENFKLIDTGNGKYTIDIDEASEFIDTPFKEFDISEILIDLDSITDTKDLSDILKQKLEKALEKEGQQLNDQNMQEIDKLMKIVLDEIKAKNEKTEEKKDNNKENQGGKTIKA